MPMQSEYLRNSWIAISIKEQYVQRLLATWKKETEAETPRMEQSSQQEHPTGGTTIEKIAWDVVHR